MKIEDVKPIPMGKAKEIMLKKEKEGLSYEQKLALEHLKEFTKLDKEKALKLIEEINSVVKLSEEILIQIVDILPKTKEELKTITSSEKFSLRDEELDKILEILKKY